MIKIKIEWMKKITENMKNNSINIAPNGSIPARSILKQSNVTINNTPTHTSAMYTDTMAVRALVAEFDLSAPDAHIPNHDNSQYTIIRLTCFRYPKWKPTNTSGKSMPNSINNNANIVVNGTYKKKLCYNVTKQNTHRSRRMFANEKKVEKQSADEYERWK